MGLRDEAAADLREIFEDSEMGFGWDITLTDPLGFSGVVTGRSNDIGQLIDMDTGIAVSGRSASVSFHIATLETAGFTAFPEGVADRSSKPWRADTRDISGNLITGKVAQSFPDRTAGVIVCMIEAYTV